MSYASGEISIRAEGIGKTYKIGRRAYGSQTFREMLAEVVSKPFRRRSAEKCIDKDQIYWALRDVGFTIRFGETVGIIGRNGAGKSTLLKIVSRITEPTVGCVKLRGRVASLLEVGTGFHPELTGRENIFLNGAILGMTRKEIRRRFDEIVTFASIERFLDTPVKHYSSGMYVRLGFAVAAYLESEILIVDEVLAVGDAEFQSRCLGKMNEIAGSGRTVLLVSHNMSAIRKLCNRALLLEQGRVRFEGRCEDAIQEYLSDGQGAKGMVEFEPTLGKAAQISYIGILGSREKPTTHLDSGEPHRICIGYRVVKRIADHRVVLKVLAADGETIFTSTSRDLSSVHAPLEPGEYKATMELPGKLLAGGKYYVSCVLGQPGVETYDVKDGVLSFTIEDRLRLMNERREGYLSYPFRWSIEPVMEPKTDRAL